MLIDARTLESNQIIRSDLCIIGAGAAGITIARALGASGLSICLLESGGLQFEDAPQSLYRGRTEGTIVHEGSTYLATSRLRFFGGTTNHWVGSCRPLDDIDFEDRPWVPDSGWPFGRSVLAPFEPRAAELLQIAPFDDPRDEGLGWPPGTVVAPSESLLTKRFHMSPPIRFGTHYRAELAESDTIRVYLHANALSLDADENGAVVRRLRVATLTGTSFGIVSTCYVLATGGVENARLLLVSDSVQSNGLGNDHDLVGRYFMEHPHVADAGQLILTARLVDSTSYDPRGAAQPVLCLSAALQRRYELLNACVLLQFRDGESPAPSTDLLGEALARLDDLASPRPVRSWAWSNCFVRAEQAPNAASRVTLQPERDALGMRRARLAWHMLDRDRVSVQRTIEVMGLEMGRVGVGRARATTPTADGRLFGEDPSEIDKWRSVGPGFHHLGTTRMARDPRRGVVDENGKVHGLTNLYVSGSSVFPTGGFANPTFTIVTLALRLADYLGRRVVRQG